MSQFYVYVKTNLASTQQYPLLLDVQHVVLYVLKTHIIIPLCKIETVEGIFIDILVPTIRFNEQKYVLMTPHIAAITVSMLKKSVDILEHSRAEVFAALDFAITEV